MDEYIDREAVLKDIGETVIHSGRPGHISAEMRGANKVIDRIKSAPAADVVEVRHGEWIKDCDTLVHCSVCKVARNNCFGIGGNLWHYCPNCGAKMDGKGDA